MNELLKKSFESHARKNPRRPDSGSLIPSRKVRSATQNQISPNLFRSPCK